MAFLNDFRRKFIYEYFFLGVVILRADVQPGLVKQQPFYKPYNPFSQVYPPLRTSNTFLKK